MQRESDEARQEIDVRKKDKLKEITLHFEQKKQQAQSTDTGLLEASSKLKNRGSAASRTQSRIFSPFGASQSHQ